MADSVKKKNTSTTKTSKTTAPHKTTAKKMTARTSNGNGNGNHASLTHEQVAQLAHKFWAERGRQHGHDEEDWFRAEQELRQ